MARTFNDIGTKFEEGLYAILTNVGIERTDFCVGYFNLRDGELNTGGCLGVGFGKIRESVKFGD